MNFAKLANKALNFFRKPAVLTTEEPIGVPANNIGLSMLHLEDSVKQLVEHFEEVAERANEDAAACERAIRDLQIRSGNSMRIANVCENLANNFAQDLQGELAA